MSATSIDDTRQILLDYFQDINWDFTEIRRQSGGSIPIPAGSKCVSAIIEEVAMENAKQLCNDIDATLIESNSRQYPDITLRNAFDNDLTAVDIKSPKISENTVEGMTLGSCGRYFSNPKQDTGGSKFPYGSYDEHWVVCHAYRWDESKRSHNMVYDIKTIIGRKWKFASAPPEDLSSTNSTNQITSQDDLNNLCNRIPHFDSKEEFEKEWRGE